ncbi:MAG: hypothetical protein ACYC4K_08690 [Thiobacillus sp.]
MPNEIKFRKFHAGQKGIFNNSLPRFSVVRAGRRFGKTTALEEWGSAKSLRGLRVGWFAPSYKLIIPTYARILQTVHPLKKSASKIDGIIELVSGGCVEFWSLDNEDAGRSRSYDLVIIDEASLKKVGLREIWEQAIRPTLLDRGGRAIMAGTPKGVDQDNFFYAACTDKSLGWAEFHAPTMANPTLDAESVAKLKDENPPLVYQQEYLAEFVDWNGSAFFSESSLLENGVAVDYPSRTDQVFAVIDTALKDGLEHDGTAVLYCCKNLYAGIPLTILDYDIIQISGDLLESWLPTVNQRLDDLAQQTNARQGNIGIWIEDKASGIVLIQQAQRKGLNVYPIDEALTSLGKEGRALAVSGYVYQGKVKLSKYAHDKIVNFKGQTRNHLLSQVCGFRMGVKTPHGYDILDTFTYSVAIALGDSQGW